MQQHVCPDGPTEWRQLDRCPGILIGDDGTIIGRSGRRLKAERGKYLVVQTKSPDGRWRATRAHVLVCEAFHGPKPEGDWEVAHGNGVPGDDCASNLRWATPKGNAADTLEHGTRRQPKLTPRKVRAIRQAFEGGATLPELARRYGVSRGLLSAMMAGKVWTHVEAPPRDEQEWARRKVVGRPGEQCPTVKLTEADVVQIRARVAAGESMYSLAPQYGVSDATIRDAVARRTWKHVP